MNHYKKAANVFLVFNFFILFFSFLSWIDFLEILPDVKSFFPVFFIITGCFVWFLNDMETFDKVRLASLWLMTISLWGLFVFTAQYDYGLAVTKTMFGYLSREERFFWSCFLISSSVSGGIWLMTNDLGSLFSFHNREFKTKLFSIKIKSFNRKKEDTFKHYVSKKELTNNGWKSHLVLAK